MRYGVTGPSAEAAFSRRSQLSSTLVMASTFPCRCSSRIEMFKALRRGFAGAEGEAIGLLGERERRQSNGEIRILLEVIPDGRSIEDHRFGPALQHQIDGAVQRVGRYHAHAASLGQFHAAGAAHHGDPTRLQLRWIGDRRFGGAGEEQGEGRREARCERDTAIREMVIQIAVSPRPMRVTGALSP